MLKRWEQAPVFKELNDRGEEIDSRDLIGSYTVVYFYPKAFTPGCTKECTLFSAELDHFSSLEIAEADSSSAETGFENLVETGARIIGISPDSPETLARFRQKHGLRVELIADPQRKVAAAYHALKENGKSILRSTFILDRWGRVRKSWYGVKVNGHVEEVLASLREIVGSDQVINRQIAYRRARRAISPRTVKRDEVKRIITAAHWSSSCFNNQPWRFIVVDQQAMLAKLHQHLPAGNYWMKEAPVLIAVYSKVKNDCSLKDGRDYYLFDTGQAVALLQVQATQMGLIAHPVAGYDQQGFKELLQIPEGEHLITVIALGYPLGNDVFLSEQHQQVEKEPRQRKELGQILSWNQYQE